MDGSRLVGAPITVGEIQVTAVSDGRLRFRPTEFFPSTVAEDWDGPDHAQFLDDEGMLSLDMASFVVRAGGLTVLVDCGLNLNDGRYALGGYLPDGLAEAGVAPSDIDVVLFTHLHLDHVGWASVAGGEDGRGPSAPFFPNATYRCHADDWEWARAEHARLFARHLAAVEDRLETVGDGDPVAPGVTVREAPGHTPGHLVVVLSGGDQRGLLLGDAVHCPVQLSESDWATWGDVDPKAAVRTREALLRELDGGDVVAAAAHFPDLAFGRLLTGAEGRTWTPLS